MITISRFEQLESRVQQLGTHFLPVLKVIGDYSDQELDQTKAFSVLSHAEIEAYLEDIALSVAKKAFEEWKLDKKRISYIIFNLACYCKEGPAKPSNKPESLVFKGFLEFEQQISKNNGIKESNLLTIFSPIGFNVDSTLISDLDSFGSFRGSLVHSSIKVHTQIDPKSEADRVSQLLTGLRELYENINTYNIHV